MPHVNTPWIGLIALVAMFVLPFLPPWLFEGPRTIRHHPRRHVCADCGAPWVAGHTCATGGEPLRGAPLRGEIWRPTRETALERRRRWLAKRDD
jgi:hypothetical protein